VSWLTRLIVLLGIALLAGGYGTTRGWGYYGWSPLAVILLALTSNLAAL
jgi:hypothetical protein